MIAKEKIDDLYEAEKVIEEDWIWDVNGPNFEGEAPVRVLGYDETLTLKAWKRRRYGFCLLYKATKIVRRWDDSIHTNPDGERLEGSHKHYWHPQYEDNYAYPVNDITLDDVDEAFKDFLDECNIELRGKYVAQKELDDA